MLPPPEDNYFAVRQASRYAAQLYNRRLAQAGITITQYTILGRLRRLGRLTMRQIAADMVMDRTSVVRAVQPLRRGGLIDSRSDGRPMLTIGLTEAGVTRFDMARTHWAAAQVEFEKGFGVERAEALRSELLALTRTERAGPHYEKSSVS